MTYTNRVLVVEDEPAVSQLIVVLLSSHGYKAEAVSSAEAAMVKARNNPDLILLNSALPDGDGFKVCHLLKSNSETKHIPIIMLSRSNDSHDRIESFHLGAQDFLHKPFEPEELFARVDAVLTRSHIQIDLIEPSYEIIQELRHIVEHESLVTYFQPIYLLKPMRLYGLEVLCRPITKGVLSNPEDLFKAAHRFGMYYELEMIVWRKALEIASRNFEHEHLFLNCSPYMIEIDRFEDIKKLFSEYDMHTRNVFLELTERSAIGEHKTFFDRLATYRELGFKIAIDDVGAGYSSLEAIVKTRPEIVKIDRQIVTGLAMDGFKKSMVKLLIAFCRENDIICIAEGVETKSDLQLLIELGVPAGQGYYLYKPTGHIDLNAMHGINL